MWLIAVNEQSLLYKKGAIMKNKILLSTLFAFFSTSIGLLAVSGVAYADRKGDRKEESSRLDKMKPRSGQQQIDRDRRNVRDYPDYRSRYPDKSYYQPRSRYDERRRIQRRPYKVIINQPRHSYRGIVILHPYRYSSPYRYRPLYLGRDDIWAWIAFTAITLKILDNLNDQQQREHERALYGATSIPLGKTVTWTRGAASGTVIPVWEGRSNTGLYCREFRQEVTIGARTEVAYGTACRRQDGSWEIVD
jgi:hypothetical protein